MGRRSGAVGPAAAGFAALLAVAIGVTPLAGCPGEPDDDRATDDDTVGDDDTTGDDDSGDDDSTGDDDTTGDDDSAGDDDTTPANDLDDDGWSTDDGDCDDTDDLVFPGAPEFCDGLDNDCDGQVDGDCLTCDQWVPADQPTIQGALDGASDGQTICVERGVWIGDLTFAGRAVRLLGPFGPTKTVISGHGSAPVVLFNTQEGADSVLEGFTIRDGGGYAGAGILMMETGPTLRSLIIRDNVADQGDGGGLAGTAATPSLTNVSILDNSSSHGGGAYLQHDSVATMTNVWIASNTAGVDGGGLQVTADSVLVLENGILAGNTAQLRGGGLALDSGAEAHFTNVAVVGNTAVFQGGGLWVHSDAVAQLTNTEISANHCGGEGGGLKVDAWPGVVFRYTNLHDNLPQDLVGQSDPVGQNGNVAVNPEFLKSAPSDPIDWDLHVQPWSPLVDAGDPARADPDGSTSDIGTFGGPEATSWDLDGDGFPVWWLPGAYDAATSPGMDCDDGDPQVFPLSGC